MAAVLSLFLIGVGVGVLGTHLYYTKQIRPPGGGGHYFAQRLEHALDLTADQKRRIDEILAASRAEGDALHREMLPRVRAHMRQTADRIREVLTPEQQARFDELQRRHRRRAEAFFLGPGRPRPHGPPRRRGPRQGPPPDRSPDPPPGD
jgi:hypothetical protein